MPVPWLLLAKVAASILPNLFGGKKKTRTSTDFVGLRRDAEAAGFNPLTALRATGGAGNRITIHPGLSSGEFLANALGTAVDYFEDNDPMKVEARRLELDLMRAEMGRIQSQVYRGPGLTGLGGGITLGVGSSETSGQNIFERPTIGFPSGIRFSGVKFEPFRAFDDAETLSQRYGEVVEMAGGVAILGGDLLYNGYLLTKRAVENSKKPGSFGEGWTLPIAFPKLSTSKQLGGTGFTFQRPTLYSPYPNLLAPRT